ncbi:MAG: aminopeptidase P family protein [Candidatus Eisenbacteria bacterium]|nr:aminopeptidase P family protein [Candidatus Eisenbacteria bacterium]
MSTKKKPAVLHIADSMTSADLLYLTRFPSGDPFIYLQSGGKTTIAVTDFEVGRASSESIADEVLPFSRLHELAGKADLVSAAAALLKWKKIRQVEVPSQFAVGAAEELRKLGVITRVKPDPFVPERQTKTSREVRMITDVQRKTEKAMENAIHWIASASVRRGTLYVGGRPLTAEMVRKRIHLDLMEEDCLGASTIVACGDQAVDPHNIGIGPLKANTPIVIDIFPRSQATYYFADITRTVVKGKASETVKKMFRTVREGQRIAFSMIRPGVRADKVHEAIVEYFQSEGFKTGIQGGKLQGFIHGTGHGLGLEIHEPPRVSKVQLQLQTGNVVTVEPGLYYKGHGGVRLEDVALVTPQGNRNLTRAPKILEV